MSRGRWHLVAVSAVAAVCLGGCGAEPGPADPTPSGAPPSASAASSSPSATTSTSPSAATASASPSVTLSGLTLRQLGFENGPLDEFSLPSDLVVSTRVDQPNVVTIVLARPSPRSVEDYLRATLPTEGFRIAARVDAGEAMTFAGNGWTGGFTGTGATSAIVLRPA